MTLMEVLKQLLGSKADEEINLDKPDDTKEVDETKKDVKDTSKSNNSEEKEKDKLDNGEKEKEKETPDKVEETSEKKEEAGGGDIMIFEDGWFNPETGEVDESKIKNEEALKAVQTLTSRVKQEKEQRMLADGLADELKNYSLNVSEETLKKVLDMSNVKIDKDNKVTGIKEAIEAVKAAEPGFFKDKEKESNPLNEGFNPVEKRTTDNIGSFAQAFKLMEEVS